MDGDFMKLILVAVGALAFGYLWKIVVQGGRIEKVKKRIINELQNRSLCLSDLTVYFCQYIGGHPKRDRESLASVWFGAKDGKLIFFEGDTIFKKKGILSGEGRINSDDEVNFFLESKLTHLFDIPIDDIKDILYFDETTKNTIGAFVGYSVAIPIRIKHEEAVVLIVWNDGRYDHSTEFRFNGVFTGNNANRRANTLRNVFIEMTR